MFVDLQTPAPQIIKRSTLSLSVRICDMRSLASFVVMLAEMTALETPHARPSATVSHVSHFPSAVPGERSSLTL